MVIHFGFWIWRGAVGTTNFEIGSGLVGSKPAPTNLLPLYCQHQWCQRSKAAQLNQTAWVTRFKLSTIIFRTPPTPPPPQNNIMNRSRTCEEIRWIGIGNKTQSLHFNCCACDIAACRIRWRLWVSDRDLSKLFAQTKNFEIVFDLIKDLFISQRFAVIESGKVCFWRDGTNWAPFT